MTVLPTLKVLSVFDQSRPDFRWPWMEIAYSKITLHCTPLHVQSCEQALRGSTVCLTIEMGKTVKPVIMQISHPNPMVREPQTKMGGL